MNIEVLSRWHNAFAISGRPTSRWSLCKQEAVLFDALEREGIVREEQLATSIDCPACLGDHAVKVQRTAAGGYEYMCIHNGRIEVAREDLVMVGFDREALLATLARTIETPISSVRRFADNRLVQIGLVEPGIGQVDWMFSFADDLEASNAFSSVISALENQTRDGPGLVATPSNIPLNVPLPRHYRFIALHDLFRLNDDQFSIDHNAAQARLRGRKQVAGKSGPKPTIGITEEIWRREMGKPDWPEQQIDQANRVRDQWPNKTRPAVGTIDNHLRNLKAE